MRLFFQEKQLEHYLELVLNLMIYRKNVIQTLTNLSFTEQSFQNQKKDFEEHLQFSKILIGFFNCLYLKNFCKKSDQKEFDKPIKINKLHQLQHHERIYVAGNCVKIYVYQEIRSYYQLYKRMQPMSKQEIVSHRNALRIGAKLLFASVAQPIQVKSEVVSPLEKNLKEESALLKNPQKISLRKRKASQDMSVFENHHKTKQISVTSNFNDLFEILEKLGEGGQASVRKCREKATGNIYAVKFFQSDTQLISNLKSQYKILKTLSNQNIIQAHYLFVNAKQNSSQMVLEYSEYPSLREYLKEEIILTEDETSAIINKLLLAISYMHNKGIAHRDIKPQNILYDKATGNIKLIDFEIAKLCKTKFMRIQMWTKTGTHQYCAPQMFKGGYTELVDIWAIGILTYQLISGKYPIFFQHVKDAVQALQQEIQYPQIFSNFAQDFIKQCLSINPLKRPTAKECLTSPFILVGSHHSPTPPASDKLNHSFDDCSTWSNAQSFIQSMKCVQQQCQQFIGDDIGIRCFSDQFYDE